MSGVGVGVRERERDDDDEDGCVCITGERGETVVGSSGLLGVAMVFELGGGCWFV